MSASRAVPERCFLALDDLSPEAALPGIRAKAFTRASLYVLYLAADILAITTAVFAAWAARLGLGASLDWARDVLSILVPFYVLLGFQLGAFRLQVLVSTAFSVRCAAAAFLSSIVATVILLFLLKVSADYSRLAFAYLTLAGVPAVMGARIATRRVARNLLNDRPEARILLVDGVEVPPGDEDLCVDAAAYGLQPGLGNPHMLDRIGQLLRGADRIVVMCAPDRRQRWAATLKGFGIGVEVLAPELDDIGALGTGRCGMGATLVVGRGPLGTRDRIIKRAFDVALVIWSLPIVLVLCALVALAVKLDSRGPVLFSQTRVGLGNRQFRMLKFRSMRTDLLDHNGRVSTLRDDHRITRVGRFIRATSLDELPQLFNVLKGDMSIVGPRPHALGSTAENDLFWEVDERYWYRHSAKPGLTGLAQVRGHRGATDSRGALIARVQSDLEYLANWSIWRDVKILLATVKVLWHRNAF